MNHQKRLISIFRTFVEKILIPQIRRVEGSLQEWGRFNSILNGEIINYNELQIYVDTLPSYSNSLFSEKKELPLHIKKREEGALNYVESFQPNFNPNKTFGGEKTKNIMMGIRQMDSNQVKRDSVKQFSQGKEYTPGKEDSFKKININSMPNIGNPPQVNYQNIPINQSLDRLLRTLLENQQKIDIIQSKY